MGFNTGNLVLLDPENRRLAIVMHPLFQSVTGDFEKAKDRFEFINSMYKSKRSSHFYSITKALLSMPERHLRDFSDACAEKELLSFDLLQKSVLISRNNLNIYYRLLSHFKEYRKAELESYKGFFQDINEKTQSPEVYIQVSRLRLFNGFSASLSDEAKSIIAENRLDKGIFRQIELLEERN